MKFTRILLAGAAIAALAGGIGTASAEPIGAGVTMYIQMGGN